MRYMGPHGPGVTRFWNEQFLPRHISHNLDRSPCYGISHHATGIRSANECRYGACGAVPDELVTTPPASTSHPPRRRYAVSDFTGNDCSRSMMDEASKRRVAEK